MHHAMIPAGLLGEVKKLADKEKGVSSVIPPGVSANAHALNAVLLAKGKGGSTGSLSQLLPGQISQQPPPATTATATANINSIAQHQANLSSAQRVSTRANGFLQSKGKTKTDPLPQFTSSSDIFGTTQQQQQQQQQQQLQPLAPRLLGQEESRPAQITVFSNAPENAFVHAETAKRVAHLVNTNASKNKDAELSFLYEAADVTGNSSNIAAAKSRAKNNPPIQPDDFSIAIPKREPDHPDEIHNLSLKPTTRKEVALLKHTMVALLNDIGCSTDQDYPTDMHAFLAMIQEEQKIYDTVFSELIRQVTINMVERGEVLAEIRRRYGNMFTKIPKHVRHLHTELIAQRKLNRRLSEELMRSKETVADLWAELDIVRKHDLEVTKQAQDAQEKLVSVLTQSDNTDEILEEYHKLYKMQRERLEEGVRKSEVEKKMWIDAAANLALRIGQEHGMVDLAQLQKQENSRLRSANHMIVIISNTNDGEMTAIETKIEEWRSRVLRLSQTVIDEDHHNIETLTKIQRSMKLVLKNLTVNEPKDAIEQDHPMLKAFHIFDVKTLAEHLMKWVEHITSVAVRFTSDSDLVFHEEIIAIRKVAEQWLEGGLKLLHRNEKNTNSKDYIPLTDVLSKIGLEIEEWLTKLESRISGEEGVASLVIGLQNQLEDRYTAFSARDFDKPLPLTERTQLKESLVYWTEQIVNLTGILTNTCEKEQQKVPLHVENWVSRVLDQMNTDTDVRNEENHKLHTAMISWMVHLLVKSGRERPSEAWDHEFLQLTQEESKRQLDTSSKASLDLGKEKFSARFPSQRRKVLTERDDDKLAIHISKNKIRTCINEINNSNAEDSIFRAAEGEFSCNFLAIDSQLTEHWHFVSEQQHLKNLTLEQLYDRLDAVEEAERKEIDAIVAKYTKEREVLLAGREAASKERATLERGA
ncbi:Axonemal dynein light chain domain-containing protein 1 [Chytriomyces hyalinus]|nr:Axonemal dynein light chain domain-containing protein 1 [Chytriomyces hyalinus]